VTDDPARSLKLRFILHALPVLLGLTLAMTTAGHALDMQGHRGARGLAPENTLPAFARALSIGVTTLELDCAITRDGVVVVSHDPLLNPDITRAADGRWLEAQGAAIHHLTFAELRRYDVGRVKPGSAYAKRFPTQAPQDGTRIPRLADVFALVRKSGNATVRFNIETKLSPLAPGETTTPEDFARRLIAAVRAAGMAHRTAIQSFDWRTLQIVQKEAPEIPTVYLTAQQDFMDNIRAHEKDSPWSAGFHVSRFGGSIPRAVRAAGGAVWSPYYREVTRENVGLARGLGLKVVVWTVNTEPEIRNMIGLGIDGIISDYPDLLRRVAGGMKLPLPAPTPVTP
jgi:glycerophosphoryl diester phosphodiesterase